MVFCVSMMYWRNRRRRLWWWSHWLHETMSILFDDDDDDEVVIVHQWDNPIVWCYSSFFRVFLLLLYCHDEHNQSVVCRSWWNQCCVVLCWDTPETFQYAHRRRIRYPTKTSSYLALESIAMSIEHDNNNNKKRTAVTILQTKFTRSTITISYIWTDSMIRFIVNIYNIYIICMWESMCICHFVMTKPNIMINFEEGKREETNMLSIYK